MNSLSKLTFKYLKQNRARTITTIVGVMISAIIIYVISRSECLPITRAGSVFLGTARRQNRNQADQSDDKI